MIQVLKCIIGNCKEFFGPLVFDIYSSDYITHIESLDEKIYNFKMFDCYDFCLYMKVEEVFTGEMTIHEVMNVDGEITFSPEKELMDLKMFKIKYKDLKI